MSEFVDTNIFVRVITQDDPVKTPRCAALFQRARRGTAYLVTSESVVAEVVYALSSRAICRMARADIALV